MSVERIRELLELMEAHGLQELELEESEFKVRLSKEGPAPQVAMPLQAPAQLPAQPAGGSAPSEAAPSQLEGTSPIESPIVGTFYSSPAPDADPFVRVGDRVDEETVVCIVEAMKVMNEVKAGARGTVAEVLVENGEAVEYGQPMFLIHPA
jgi:acetyl-CoA carboxylase biotin carboxyl carrier protein